MKETKGITLIALIITIIVLLILAGVALATLTGEGSIIQNAENAVAQYNNSVEKEQMLLNNIDKYLENEEINQGEIIEENGITGRCTLLFEKEISRADLEEYEEYTENVLSIESLDKYKYISAIAYFDGDNGSVPEFFENAYGAVAGYIPVQILKENNSRYFMLDVGSGWGSLKYVDENTLSIVLREIRVTTDTTITIKIYGIE